MARPTGKPRVQARKAAADNNKEKPGKKVKLSTRPAEEKTDKFRDELDRRKRAQTERPDISGMGIEIEDQIFYLGDIDEDALAAIESVVTLGEESSQTVDIFRALFTAESFPRLRVWFTGRVKEVLQARRDWKKEGSDPEGEPVSVREWSTQVIEGIVGVLEEQMTDPKG